MWFHREMKWISGLGGLDFMGSKVGYTGVAGGEKSGLRRGGR